MGFQQNLWVKNNFHHPLSILRSRLLRRTGARGAEKGRMLKANKQDVVLCDFAVKSNLIKLVSKKTLPS